MDGHDDLSMLQSHEKRNSKRYPWLMVSLLYGFVYAGFKSDILIRPKTWHFLFWQWVIWYMSMARKRFKPWQMGSLV